MVPVTPCPQPAPTIDGDLTEWGDLRRGGVFLSQRADAGWGTYQAGAKPDGALLKLVADAQALYLAARVADGSVLSPRGTQAMWEGDCVEVFLDLRPLEANRDVLGTPEYTRGVCQFVMMPPTDDGKPSACVSGKHGGVAPGPVTTAARRVKGGYEIEMRLPLASVLPDGPKNRLEQPFGFEVQIDDIDAPDTPAATARCSGYSLSHTSGFSDNASIFACASRTEVARPLHRLEPAIFSQYDREWVARAVVAGEAASPAPTDLQLKWRREASAYDLPPATDLHTDKIAQARLDSTVTRDEWPLLGVWAAERGLCFTKLAPGRYYLTARCHGAAEDHAQARFYVSPNWRRPRLAVGSPSADEVARGIDFPVLDDFYPRVGTDVEGRGWVGTPGCLAFALSSEAARAEKAGQPFTPKWQLALTLVPNGDTRELWTTSWPMKDRLRFKLPTKDLPPGLYDLRTTLLTPDGPVSVARSSETARGPIHYDPTLTFRIMAADQPTCRFVVKPAGKMMRRAECLGNPAREQFPKDDMRDCQARSVHDLQWFDGRIYIGVGDWNENRGPIKIVSFAPVGPGDKASFVPEFSVDDESVDRFRVCGKTLYVPGIDARESWDSGNYYFKRDGKWTKRRTLPNAVHVLDIAEHDGKLYAATGTETGGVTYESADDGLTWRPFAPSTVSEWRVWQVVPMKQGLLVLTERPNRGGYLLRDGNLEPLYLPILPNLRKNWTYLALRATPFGDGAVYTSYSYHGPAESTLFWLPDLESRPVAVEGLGAVTDVIVRDDACHALAVKPASKNRWRGTVYTTTDLCTWTRAAEAIFPGIPASLELSGGAYYVGLANSTFWKSADRASGEVWRLGQ